MSIKILVNFFLTNGERDPERSAQQRAHTVAKWQNQDSNPSPAVYTNPLGQLCSCSQGPVRVRFILLLSRTAWRAWYFNLVTNLEPFTCEVNSSELSK